MIDESDTLVKGAELAGEIMERVLEPHIANRIDPLSVQTALFFLIGACAYHSNAQMEYLFSAKGVEAMKTFIRMGYDSAKEANES